MDIEALDAASEAGRRFLRQVHLAPFNRATKPYDHEWESLPVKVRLSILNYFLRNPETRTMTPDKWEIALRGISQYVRRLEVEVGREQEWATKFDSVLSLLRPHRERWVREECEKTFEQLAQEYQCELEYEKNKIYMNDDHVRPITRRRLARPPPEDRRRTAELEKMVDQEPLTNEFDRAPGRAKNPWKLPQLIYDAAGFSMRAPETEYEDPFKFTLANQAHIVRQNKTAQDARQYAIDQAWFDRNMRMTGPGARLLTPRNWNGPITPTSWMDYDAHKDWRKYRHCTLLAQKLRRAEKRAPRRLISEVVRMIELGLGADETDVNGFMALFPDMSYNEHISAVNGTERVKSIEYSPEGFQNQQDVNDEFEALARLCEPMQPPRYPDYEPLDKAQRIFWNRIKSWYEDRNPLRDVSTVRPINHILRDFNSNLDGPVKKHYLESETEYFSQNSMRSCPTVKLSDWLEAVRIGFLGCDKSSLAYTLGKPLAHPEHTILWTTPEGDPGYTRPPQGAARSLKEVSEFLLVHPCSRPEVRILEDGKNWNYFGPLAYRFGMTWRDLNQARLASNREDEEKKRANSATLRHTLGLWEKKMENDETRPHGYSGIIRTIDPDGFKKIASSSRTWQEEEQKCAEAVRRGIILELHGNKPRPVVGGPPRAKSLWSFALRKSSSERRRRYWSVDRWPPLPPPPPPPVVPPEGGHGDVRMANAGDNQYPDFGNDSDFEIRQDQQ